MSDDAIERQLTAFEKLITEGQTYLLDDLPTDLQLESYRAAGQPYDLSPVGSNDPAANIRRWLSDMRELYQSSQQYNFTRADIRERQTTGDLKMRRGKTTVGSRTDGKIKDPASS
jgi:hypothetical protein